MYSQSWKYPFHTLLVICNTPLSAFFSSEDPTFTQNQNFSEIFSSKNLKLSQNSAHKAILCSEIQYYTRIIQYWSVLKPLLFSSSGHKPIDPTKRKVKCPRRIFHLRLVSQNWPRTSKNWLTRFCENNKGDHFFLINEPILGLKAMILVQEPFRFCQI